jgi:Tfp pilus assembly protein PilE
LEYYAGVLFLTTNRVGDFDEAFTSRIHVSLYYPELSKGKTLQVFEINVNLIDERFEDKKRTIVIDDITAFASDHYTNHPLARWNGRQIRNACQTALALAEFEAQGNSHESVLKPNALVHLKVSHFQTVQKAYLEFAQYMNSLYGSTSSTRAKESKMRAIWIDENNNVVGTQSMGGAFKSKQDAFLLKSQPQPQPQQEFQQQVPLQSQQGFQQQAFPTANQGVPNPGMQQYYQYSNVVPPQPMYAQASGQMQMQPPQQFPPNQLWNGPGVNVVTGQGGEQNRAPPQLPPTTPPPPQQQQQQQQQGNPAWLGQNIQAMYAAGSPQGSEQRSPNNLPATGGGGYPPGPSAPGQQWQGPQGPAGNP